MSDHPASDTSGELAFFGTITASVTHELSNVIAIINELAGLLDDLLYAAKSGKPVDPEKLQKLHDRLVHQVARGDRIVRRLNRFAHSVDHPAVQFDVHAVLDDLVRFARRLTDLKRVELKAALSERSPVLVGNPFAFQRAVFLGIGHLLGGSREGGVISVATENDAETVTVVLQGEGLEEAALDDAMLTVASAVVESMRGRMDTAVQNDRKVLRFTLPSGTGSSA